MKNESILLPLSLCSWGVYSLFYFDDNQRNANERTGSNNESTDVCRRSSTLYGDSVRGFPDAHRGSNQAKSESSVI